MKDNNSSQYFHETIVRDIVDIIADVKDKGLPDEFSNRKMSYRSAASATSGLTLVFPVLISDTIGVESAGMICKALERKAASMMQMLFSAFAIDNATDAIEYVKKFHTNVDTSRGITVDSLIDALDKYAVEGDLFEHVDMTAVEKIREEAREMGLRIAVEEDAKNNLNYVLSESVNEESLNIYKFTKDSNTPMVFSEAKSKSTNQKSKNYTYRPVPTNVTVNPNITVNGGFGRTGDARPAKHYDRDTAEYFNKQLIPTDVKKANELVPTMMTVNFVSTNKNNGEAVKVEDVVIGIKAKLYPLSSLDIINRIKLKNQDNNGFNKFIRATTREISFFKDFLFAIDKAKIDAISQSRRGSSNKFWKVLERRSLKSKVRRSLRMNNDASAISTLVVSREEVEYLKKTENINVENPNVIRPIMEAYNLMGFVIVDETQEVASFIFDSGDDMYEQVSFNNLERESNDGSTKKIINLMTKIAR